MQSENIKATYEWLRERGFMATLKIDREVLVLALMSERYFLNNNRIPETDVRLVVYAHDVAGTMWDLKTGDVSYDSAHGIACGAGEIGRYDTNDALRELADDLISQVEDQYAEEQS